MHTHSGSCHSRRDFSIRAFAGVLAGKEILRVEDYPSAREQGLPSAATPEQFEIQKVAADVYFAQVRPWALPNSNAAIFVNPSDVLVVDAQSHPAAATTLIAQIRKEVTSKPVRW